MVSAEEFDRLKRRDRQVFSSDDLPDEVVEVISRAEVPAQYAALNAELADREPS